MAILSSLRRCRRRGSPAAAEPTLPSASHSVRGKIAPILISGAPPRGEYGSAGFSSSPLPFGDFALLMRVVDRRTRAGFPPVAPRRGGGRRSSPTRARRASATRGTRAPHHGRRQAPGGESPTVTGSPGVPAGSRTRALRSRTDVPTPGRRGGAEPAGRFRGEGGLPRQRCRPARSHRGRRGRRRGIGRSVFSVPPREASLLALSRAMRASSPAWRTEVFSFSPLSRCASRRRSSSRFSVVRICMSMAARCSCVKAGRWSGGARGELNILSPRQNPIRPTSRPAGTFRRQQSLINQPGSSRDADATRRGRR
jgi:hypothetical protein